MPLIEIDKSDLHYPPCDVCDGTSFEHLARLRSPRMLNFTSGVAICRGCGYVGQRPRPAGSTYAQINDVWFSETFETDDPAASAKAKKFRKWELMWRRIGASYPQGPKHLLDVGAGQGWAIEYLRSLFPAMPATAIERWPPCQEYIRTRLGADVVDLEPTGEWPAEFARKFDLIIFRHTLEHLNDPIKALRNIAAALAPGGGAYIVVPNAGSVREGSAMRTDFFRPVHLHYFTEETLKRLAARVGLAPRLFAAEGELWGLFENGKPAVEQASAYAAERALLKKRLAESAWRDRKVVLRSALAQAYRMLRPGGRVASSGGPG